VKKARPYVLTIAGFDPSAGAGVLADIKTMEACRVYGVGVLSATTLQNEREFDSVSWLSSAQIIAQVETIARTLTPAAIKIGIIENTEVLGEVVSYLGQRFRNVPVVWDPVLVTSAGARLSENPKREELNRVMQQVHLVTPNIPEVLTLAGEEGAIPAAKSLATNCNVYLKGGHSLTETGRDSVFLTDGRIFSFRARKTDVSAKHGSGCVLSSAIASNLALGYPLLRACLRAKQYTERFLGSSPSLLGYHRI
jgi:hydroxymethylpyrimidine/phosphomethylpyrimidine kinase